jgi:hypothetical protein
VFRDSEDMIRPIVIREKKMSKNLVGAFRRRAPQSATAIRSGHDR